MNLRLFNDVELTNEEAEFIEAAGQLPKKAESRQSPELMTQAKLSQNRITSEIYFIKHLEKSVSANINSNKDLTSSNEKHTKAMRWLTSAPVLAAFVQIIVTIFK